MLIDLEQQVEFFLVLGQDDAAEELLLTRVHTGLTSTLPYLKLLGIYQRLGRESAFEGMAERFAVRFKALPPTWGTGAVVGELSRDAARPANGLDESWQRYGQGVSAAVCGVGAVDWLRLPAYLDLLLLYSLARDLSGHEVRGEEIDLFLPLDVDAVSTNEHGMMATLIWQAPAVAVGAAIDLDISLDDLPLDKR